MKRIFYRGVNVASWNVDAVLEALTSGNLNGDIEPGMWHKRYPKPIEVAHRTDLRRELTEIQPRDVWLPASYACGDLEGAAHYAWKKGAPMGTSVPIIVEFEVDILATVIDGRDSLYSIIHCAHREEACLIIERGWGKAIRPYLDLAAASFPDNRQFRHALVDLACTDEEVKSSHYENATMIAGRYNTKFRSAFMVPNKILPAAVRRVWISEDRPTWEADDEMISVPILVRAFAR